MRRDDGGRGAGPIPGLSDLYAGRTPSADLEDRVVESLRASGALDAPRKARHGRRGPTAFTAAWQAAAALVLFVGGVWVGATRIRTPGSDDSVALAPQRFMLLLWEDESFQPPEDPEAVAAAYAAWAGSVASSGTPISGDELAPERSLVGPASIRSGGGATLGGYFVVGAASMREARALVEGHPHLMNGGAIEIAPIVVR